MTPAPSSQSPVTNWHVVAYAVVAVVGAMLAALDAGISKGAIPLPQALTPFLPVIVAGLTILTALLPKVTDGVPALGVRPPEAPPAPAVPSPAPAVPAYTFPKPAPVAVVIPVAPETAPQSPPPVPVAPETPPA